MRLARRILATLLLAGVAVGCGGDVDELGTGSKGDGPAPAGIDAGHGVIDTPTPPTPTQPTQPKPPPQPIEFQHGLYEDGKADAFPGYQQWYGPNAITVVGDYTTAVSWKQFELSTVPEWKAWVNASPTTRHVNLAVHVWPVKDATVSGSLAACAAGDYNAHYRALAKNLHDAGMGATIFRFGWEEYGDWYAWTTKKQTAGKWAYDATLIAQFKSCFIQFYKTVHAADVDPEAIVTLDLSDEDPSFNPSIYPEVNGVEYVDQLSTDIYDRAYSANTYPFPAACTSAACRAPIQEAVWQNQIRRRLVDMANFATAHGKVFNLGEFGINRLTPGNGVDNGGDDDPGFIQHIYNFMHGNEPGMNPGFRPGYASYFEANADGHTCETRLRDTSGYVTLFPNAAAKYLVLFGGR